MPHSVLRSNITAKEKRALTYLRQSAEALTLPAEIPVIVNPKTDLVYKAWVRTPYGAVKFDTCQTERLVPVKHLKDITSDRTLYKTVPFVTVVVNWQRFRQLLHEYRDAERFVSTFTEREL